MLKEKQLAELADRSQRMRLKIGSHGPNSGDKKQSSMFSKQEVNQMREKRAVYRQNRSGMKSSISPRNQKSKSPGVGGGMRAQQVRDRNIDSKIQNRLSREREI